MTSKTEICNLAIANIGVGKNIANLDTEKSAEANVCRLYYATARDQTLRDFDWPFATSFVNLGLVEECPSTEWRYSYRYPSDCLMLRRVFSKIRTDNRQSVIPYKIVRDSAGLLIYCDMENAEIEYTIKTDDPTFYSPDYIMALSFRMAAYIAPNIAAGDAMQLTERALKRYYETLSEAQSNAANEQKDDPSPESEFIRTREGYDSGRFRNEGEY